MAWWGWVIAGAILFGAELSFVSAHFYLVFVGIAAVVVGLVTAVVSPAAWAQWALFAALAIISMLAFRSRIYQRFRSQTPAVRSGPVGGTMTLGVPLAAGATCQTEYSGTLWTVRNDSGQPLPSGARVRITGVHDLTLLVRPEP